MRKNNPLYGIAKKLIINDEGWTFIETIIVLGIILVLTSTVGFTAIRYLDKAKVVAARSQIESFVLALDSYRIDVGSYPTEAEGLSALYQKPSGTLSDNWFGPYINKQIPKDPWNREYIYRVPGPNGLAFMIISLGADGEEGGEGINADITSY